MSGPVWRFEAKRSGHCSVCLRPAQGMFVEGEVAGNSHLPTRLVCGDCFGRWGALVTAGEAGADVTPPAYARRPT